MKKLKDSELSKYLSLLLRHKPETIGLSDPAPYYSDNNYES